MSQADGPSKFYHMEQVKEEFEGLKTIIEWNPNWRDEKD